MNNIMLIIYWMARLVAALILLQTLFFKFTAAEESVYIFTTVGMEPWGRIGVGIFEFIAAILLIIPATAWMGGILALGLMLGAIGMHLTILGIEVKGDGGYLFALALAVALCSIFVVWRNVSSIISFASAIRKRFN
jgi:putative oxidoreductase